MKKRQAKKETASQGTRRKASVKLNRPKPLKASKAVKPKKKNSVRPKPVKRNVESLTESNGNKDELDYNIIGSSSKGNCVRIENIMVDIGMPFKYIKEDLYKTDIILITHIHSDHIKQSVFHRIREDFPDIKIVGNHEVACQYDIDFICNENTPFEMDGYTITPFKAVHNVLCYGYIWNAKGKDIIYCTDSSDFDNSPENMKYDYLFLESNHDQHKLNAIRKTNQYRKYGYNAYESGLRHCSTQKCMAFYYKHRKNPESLLIELHKSERFY